MLYLPDRDHNGGQVEHIETWVTDACMLLVQIAGGATLLPPAQGYWRTATGVTVRELTHIVFSYLTADAFLTHNRKIKAFLNNFAQATGQETIALEFDGKLYFHSDFAAVA